MVNEKKNPKAKGITAMQIGESLGSLSPLAYQLDMWPLGWPSSFSMDPHLHHPIQQHGTGVSK